MRNRAQKQVLSFALSAALAGCGAAGDDPNAAATAAEKAHASDATAAVTADVAADVRRGSVDRALRDKVKNIVFIYAENRSFDSIFGNFPGANGIPGINPSAKGSIAPQTDRDAANTPLGKLPQTWGGVTAAGQTPVVTQAMSDNLANDPYSIEATYPGVDEHVINRDLYHRFFENQMQINGGKNDKFAAYADSGGLVMGHYDTSRTALWKLARQYVLADNFFQAAFGGSFLNHQYLVCGCAPAYPHADSAAAKPTIAVVDGNGHGGYLPRLTINSVSSPASALDGAPIFTLSGNLAPKNYFGDNQFHAINTMQPPYQPSGNGPAASDATKLYADPNAATTLPPQTALTIGDLMDAGGVSWAWYSGAWDETTEEATSTHTFPPSSLPGSAPNFQFHHQPFNFYAKFDPQKGAAARKAHLKDYDDLVADAAAGRLPEVVFYKPEGDLNQHPGYASIAAGDAHIADLVAKLQASPQWKNMVVVITYDENGGWWDHVAPPKADRLGPGTRIPAIVISPLAKRGVVDHTQYDTASIVRLISRRFGLPLLPGLVERDLALLVSGSEPMGDLTHALDL